MGRVTLFAFSLVLIAALITGSKSENVNPEGFDDFDPAYVWKMKMEEPVEQIIDDSSTHYYWVEVPEDAAAVEITVTNKNFGDSCSTSLRALLNFALGHSLTTGFPCSLGGSTTTVCGYLDTLYASGTPVVFHIDAFSALLPGEKIFISIQGWDIQDGDVCEYEVLAAVSQTCDDGQSAMTNSTAGVDTCADYTMVEDSDDIKSGTLDVNEYHVFRTDYPKNTVRAWVKIISTSATGWFVGVSPGITYDSWSYTGYDYVSDTNKYVTYYQTDVPYYGENYWYLRSNEDGADYTIQFHWDVCDSDKVGAGEWEDLPDGENPTDCYIEQNDAEWLPNEFPLTKTFKNVYSQEPSIHSYGGINYLIKVPFGTTGHINITCETSDMSKDSWIGIGTGGQMADCYNYYDWITCSDVWHRGPLLLLSNTLYGGGQFSLVLCTAAEEGSSVDFTLTMNGMVELGDFSSASTFQFGYFVVAVVFALLF